MEQIFCTAHLYVVFSWVFLVFAFAVMVSGVIAFEDDDREEAVFLYRF